MLRAVEMISDPPKILIILRTPVDKESSIDLLVATDLALKK